MSRMQRFLRPLAIVGGASFMAALLVAAAPPGERARAAEPAPEKFDASCHWDAERGGPNPLIVTGFTTDSADVPVTQEAAIIAYARDLTNAEEICVVGQADKRGPSAYNDHLAMRRARAVAARLIGAGIDPAHLSLSSRAEAFGDKAPGWLWSSGSRRVEVMVIR